VAQALETWRVHGIELAIGEPEQRVRERALAAVGIGADALRGFRIAKKSLDARRIGGTRRLRFVVHAELVLPVGFASAGLARAQRAGRVVRAPERGQIEVERVHVSLRGQRVAVLGAGPAGLFAALVLARNGIAVDLVDRGDALRERGRALTAFDRTRVADPESNLLFGEGGAGTYSDGKLYTRVAHPLEIPLLEELIACGAPPAIAYDARAHVGTDRLHRILPALRARLEADGVRFHFRTRVDGLVLDATTPSQVCALASTHGEIPCAALVLAPGHSARDTWHALAAQGVQIRAGAKVGQVTVGTDGVTIALTTTTDTRMSMSRSQAETIAAERVLVAVGRRPRTEGLGLEALGVQMAGGFIVVNETMQTSVPGVYAIGDCVPTLPLAHVASAEGVLAVEHLAGREVAPLNYDKMPRCTYSRPEVASIGLTEEEAVRRGYQVKVGRFPFQNIARSAVLGENEGLVKIVCDVRYDEILGVHLVGPQATELIAEAAALLRLEATTEELVRTVHAHPTLAEALQEAGHAVRDQAIYL
jgi:uncharacterized FAD-dependent dehydrogenase